MNSKYYSTVLRLYNCVYKIKFSNLPKALKGTYGKDFKYLMLLSGWLFLFPVYLFLTTVISIGINISFISLIVWLLVLMALGIHLKRNNVTNLDVLKRQKQKIDKFDTLLNTHCFDNEDLQVIIEEIDFYLARKKRLEIRKSERNYRYVFLFVISILGFIIADFWTSPVFKDLRQNPSTYVNIFLVVITFLGIWSYLVVFFPGLKIDQEIKVRTALKDILFYRKGVLLYTTAVVTNQKEVFIEETYTDQPNNN